MGTKNTIGLWSAVSIGIGGMIGAGIFSILGIACQIAGNAVYLSFIIAGMVALLSTYSYARLGARFPSAGGPTEFLVRGFGDCTLAGGFNILLWVGYVFALALYARAFGSYAWTFLPTDTSLVWISIFATGIVILFTIVNMIGAKAVGKSELMIVAIKTGILIVLAVFGFVFMKSSLLSVAHWPHTSNIFFGAGIIFLAYEGFGLVTNAAEDIDEPRKTLPKALYLSVIIVIFVYISVSLAVVGNLPIPEVIRAKDYALAEAAKPFLGLIGFKIIAIAALFSTSSAINATLYGGTNVAYMMAKDGELPEVFERKLWAKSTEGLFITAGLVILIANLFDLGGIAMFGSATFLIIYAAVNFSHLRLCNETGANPYWIWFSIVGCLLSLGILIAYEVKHSLMTLLFLGLVVGLSFLAERIYRTHSQRALKTRKCDIQ